MSDGRVGKPSEHPARVQNEPLDDIILGDDEETTEIPSARKEPVTQQEPARFDGPGRSERPSRGAPSSDGKADRSDESRKSVRQKLLRIPDDEIARPHFEGFEEAPPPPPPPPPMKKPVPTFDPESTVKMNALELDSSTQLPPMDSGPSVDEDSWTPLQAPVHVKAHVMAPKTTPEPWNPQKHAANHANPDGGAHAKNDRGEFGDRSELPTPPPTSEEIPVAVEDPASSERIPAAQALAENTDEDGDTQIEPPPDSSPIGLTQRSDSPPARKSTAPSSQEPMREQLRTVLDTGEIHSIDVSFQSTPNLEVASEAHAANAAPRVHPPTDPPDSGNDSNAMELGAEDMQAVDSRPPQPLSAATSVAPGSGPASVPHAPSAPSAPPPLRPKTQSTPSVPPLRPKAPSAPPGPPPMRAKAGSGPPPTPTTAPTPTVQAVPAPPPVPAAASMGPTPPSGGTHPPSAGASMAPPLPPMRPRTQSTPSVPPIGMASTGPAPAAIMGGPSHAPLHPPPTPNAPPNVAANAGPSGNPLAQSGQNPALSTGPKPPPPKPGQQKPLLMVPSLLNSANGLAPPSMAEAQGRSKKVRPWWEDLFNDDFIRAMEKLTDSQIKREADFIEDSLGVAAGAMVLDLACGTGRHAIELSKRGYNVVGFDLSLAMLARAADEAEERNAQLNFVQGDMREMTFNEMFDGIYCWSTSFGFFEEEKNMNVIQRVHHALKKGGQFLLDVVNRDYVARQSPSLVWFEGDGAICMDEMQVDWITSRMKIKRTMMIDDGRSREIEFSMRLYALHELGKMLHDAGFRVAEVSGRVATPGVFFGADSPRTIILAEKR